MESLVGRSRRTRRPDPHSLASRVSHPAIRGRGWLRLDARGRRRLPRILLATAVMGAVVGYALTTGHALFPALAASSLGRLGLLVVLVTLGVAVYLGALQLLGVAKFKDLISAVRTSS